MTGRDDDQEFGALKSLILSELKRLDSELKGIRGTVENIRVDIAVLKAKSVTWGALGGFAVAVITAVISSLINAR